MLLSVKFFITGNSVFSERSADSFNASDVILFGLNLRIFPRNFNKFLVDDIKIFLNNFFLKGDIFNA